MKTKSIYRILATLLKYAGREDFDNQLISAEKLKMSYSEWEQLMILLQKKGYVDGVIYMQTLSDRFPKVVDISHVQCMIPQKRCVSCSIFILFPPFL